jgi:tetratricopeptide (TPR) repeat protein
MQNRWQKKEPEPLLDQRADHCSVSRVLAGKIFINYRRDHSISTAGRLQDRLALTFGRKNLFMDVDHVPAGVDFVDYLHSQVSKCDVFLAVIGPNWVDAKDDSGRRRFDNPNDYVAVEIAAALARNIRVIPVLIDGARTPKADKLPDSIKPLARRNAVEVRNTNFGRDVEALTNKVREALKSARPVTAAARRLASATLAGLTVGAAALFLVEGYRMGVPVWLPWTPSTEQPDPPRADKAKAPADAEAQRKAAEEAERQRLAAVQAEEDRKAAEAEQKRVAAAALMSRSDIESNNGDYDRAIATVSEAIRLDPKNALAFYYRGRAYVNKGDDDRAIADYSEAIRLDPKNARVLCYRGRAKLRINDRSGYQDIATARELDASICQ